MANLYYDISCLVVAILNNDEVILGSEESKFRLLEKHKYLREYDKQFNSAILGLGLYGNMEIYKMCITFSGKVTILCYMYENNMFSDDSSRRVFMHFARDIMFNAYDDSKYRCFKDELIRLKTSDLNEVNALEIIYSGITYALYRRWLKPVDETHFTTDESNMRFKYKDKSYSIPIQPNLCEAFPMYITQINNTGVFVGLQEDTLVLLSTKNGKAMIRTYGFAYTLGG